MAIKKLNAIITIWTATPAMAATLARAVRKK